jgi:GNAT superfamily N-acetyltransferase
MKLILENWRKFILQETEEKIKIISYFDEDYDFLEEMGLDPNIIVDQVDKIHEQVKIRPDSTKELQFLALEGDRIVGLSYGTVHGGSEWNYSFDTLVEPASQGRGVGKELIDAAIEKYTDSVSELEEMYDNAKMTADIVNEKFPERIAGYLESKGFVETSTSNNRIYMEYKPQGEEELKEAVELKTPNVVSFDFDDTLSRNGAPQTKMLDIMRGHYDMGDIIIIMTARPKKGMADVNSFVKKHELPVRRAYYTNKKLKGQYLKNLGCVLHYDDDKEQRNNVSAFDIEVRDSSGNKVNI